MNSTGQLTTSQNSTIDATNQKEHLKNPEGYCNQCQADPKIYDYYEVEAETKPGDFADSEASNDGDGSEPDNKGPDDDEDLESPPMTLILDESGDGEDSSGSNSVGAAWVAYRVFVSGECETPWSEGGLVL